MAYAVLLLELGETIDYTPIHVPESGCGQCALAIIRP